MSEKLKPCPFCGGKAEYGSYVGYSIDSSFDYIGCDNCGAKIIDGTPGEWNARHIPEGYALVPVEPTLEMREAFHASYEDYENGDASCPDAQWKAMIAAARAQPG